MDIQYWHNGYNCRFNVLFNEWIVSHFDIGVCGSYCDLNDAFEDMRKG